MTFRLAWTVWTRVSVVIRLSVVKVLWSGRIIWLSWVERLLVAWTFRLHWIIRSSWVVWSSVVRTFRLSRVVRCSWVIRSSVVRTFRKRWVIWISRIVGCLFVVRTDRSGRVKISISRFSSISWFVWSGGFFDWIVRLPILR